NNDVSGVNNHSSKASRLSVAAHDLSAQSTAHAAFVCQNDHISRLGHIQGFVEQKVISCRCIYGKCSTQETGLGIQGINAGVNSSDPAAVIVDICYRNASEGFYQFLCRSFKISSNSTSYCHFLNLFSFNLTSS